MAKIEGGVAVSDREASLKSLLDDVTEIHTQFTALLTKLDSDSGVDADYVATTDVAALTTTQ